MLPSVKIVDQSDKMRKLNPILDIASFLGVGDSVGIIVPVDSVPNMPPGYDYTDHLVYQIAITEILSPEEFQVRMDEERRVEQEKMREAQALLPEVEALTEKVLAEYKAGTLSLEETDMGVKYHIHEKGDGILPTKDRMLTMSYYGRNVSDGKMFDNSYKRGQGYSFRVGRRSVIAGWDDIALYLPVGTKASVFIPSEMGYGAQGSPPNIGPGEELYFYLTVDDLYY